MEMAKRTAGFTLIELLVGTLLTSVVLVGAIGVFTSHNRTYIQQDLSLSMEEDLRMGMGMVSDTLRTAGYGVPLGNLSIWIPWVSGFNSNPQIYLGPDGATKSVSIASCFRESVANLSAATVAGATTLSLSSGDPESEISDLLNTGAKRLIFIGNSENAQVTGVSGSSITIDAAPTMAGSQGLRQAYPAGTPICRIDVLTLAVYTDAQTGLSWLALDTNQGAGAQPAVEDITRFELGAVAARQYQVTLTARSEKIGPLTGTYLTRTLTSNVTLKN
jgi:type II secretory pathway pseudopilin PulG